MKKTILTVLSVIITVSLVFSQSITTSGLTSTKKQTTHYNKSEDGIYFITHSTSQTILAGNSVACNSGGMHTDNSYLRIFDLVGDFSINEDIEISSIEFGIEKAVSGGGVSQPVTVNIYTLTGAFIFANLSLIATTDIEIPDQTLSIYSAPITALIPLGSQLVIEIFTPDGQPSNNSFYLGSNNLGETAPSYLAAAGCGIPEPLTTGAIGFPQMQMVINVNADPASIPVPISSWAILLSGLLISLFVVIRIRN